MSIVTPEVLRQQLMRPVVLQNIDRQGLSIDSEPVHRSLETVRRVVASDGDTSREMHNLSSPSVLLSADDRSRVLLEFVHKLQTVRRV